MNQDHIPGKEVSMKLYQIYYPLIESSAKFKTLLSEETDQFVEKYSDLPKIEYMLLVLHTCVYNLKTDILVALRKMSPMAADEMLMSMYNGCIMLNPALDIDTWMNLTQSYNVFHQKDMMLEPVPRVVANHVKTRTATDRKKKPTTIPLSKFVGLERYLNDKVIGQNEAVHQIASALKRAQANLNDPERPIGVFFFCGPSGVGKTLIAKELQKYLYDGELIRIDCGEYQHKHENQKLIGSPNGYVGFEEGGQLTKAIAKNPNTVLLIDEAEKAHPDFWNTFLKVFDDGYITDNKGSNISFKNTIIIITSNLGNEKVSKETYGRRAGFTGAESSYQSKTIPSRALVERETEESVRKYFKPELINRLDDIVIFNHLNREDFRKIAELELLAIATKLSKQQFDLSWNDDVLDLLSQLSGVSIEGARGMSKVRREKIENPLADILLNRKHPKGTMFNIIVQDESFVIS
jgi:ATP-dependent Clp protease ATP-binding subunit ClpA